MGQPGSIDDIRPFAELAQNATTVVYKAYQTSLERFVLLKRLRPTYYRDEDLAARFQEEARIAARVQHPNVMSIYAFGRDNEGAYIVAEFVDGLDLSKVVERSRIPPDLALYVLAESARGLKAAHEKNVLHRDLKPSNILISRDGEVKLSDFGLASVSSVGSPSEIRGTLAYFAPEQILDNAIDARSDLYSLGATFFEMLTGRRAFPGSSSQDVFDAILNRNPLPYLSATAGVDEDIEAICARLLARDPSDRYPDAGAVIRAAEECMRARRANADAALLSAFLDDPEAFAVPAASARPVVVQHAASADPVVTVVPESSEGLAGRSGRKAVGAAAVLLLSAALVYAGVLVLRPSDDAVDLGAARGVGDTGVAATADDADTTLMNAGADLTAGDAATTDAGVNAGADPPDDMDTVAPAGAETPLSAGDVGAGLPDDVAQGDTATVRSAGPPTGAEGGEDPTPDDERAPAVYDDMPVASVPGYVRVIVDTLATVFVDGDSMGVARAASPLLFPLAPGVRSLELRNRSFPREHRLVDVQSDDTVSVEHALWSTVGQLILLASPWADVYVDGEYVGQAPSIREALILRPAVHDVRFVNPELGVDTTTTIMIPKGEIVTRRFICPTSNDRREKTVCQLR